MDTRIVMGRAMFQLVAVFAELKRGQNHERIAAAKAAGVHCGRRRSLSPAHVDDARTKIRDERWSWARTAAFHRVSRTTPSTTGPTSPRRRRRVALCRSSVAGDARARRTPPLSPDPLQGSLASLAGLL